MSCSCKKYNNAIYPCECEYKIVEDLVKETTMSEEDEGISEKEYDRARTMSVLKELLKGRHIPLNDGTIIAMGEDMSIGFWYNERVVSPMGLHDLNNILNRNSIGIVVK